MRNQPYSIDPHQQNEQQAPSPENTAPPDDPLAQMPRGEVAYEQRQQVINAGPARNQVETSAVDIEDSNLNRATTRRWISTVAYFVLSVLEVILAMRFFFRLLGASQSSNFVLFLYNLSHVFVAPFNGIFQDQTLGGSVFEISTLTAMIVLALIFWGIVSLSKVIFAYPLKNEQRITTIHRHSL